MLAGAARAAGRRRRWRRVLDLTRPPRGWCWPSGQRDAHLVAVLHLGLLAGVQGDGHHRRGRGRGQHRRPGAAPGRPARCRWPSPVTWIAPGRNTAWPSGSVAGHGHARAWPAAAPAAYAVSSAEVVPARARAQLRAGGIAELHQVRVQLGHVRRRSSPPTGPGRPARCPYSSTTGVPLTWYSTWPCAPPARPGQRGDRARGLVHHAVGAAVAQRGVHLRLRRQRLPRHRRGRVRRAGARCDGTRPPNAPLAAAAASPATATRPAAPPATGPPLANRDRSPPQTALTMTPSISRRIAAAGSSWPAWTAPPLAPPSRSGPRLAVDVACRPGRPPRRPRSGPRSRRARRSPRSSRSAGCAARRTRHWRTAGPVPPAAAAPTLSSSAAAISLNEVTSRRARPGPGLDPTDVTWTSAARPEPAAAPAAAPGATRQPPRQYQRQQQPDGSQAEEMTATGPG